MSAKKNKLWSMEKFKNSSMGLILESNNIEIKGNKEAVIEGVKNIEHYDENVIKLKMNKMIVSFFGKNMEIKFLSYDSMVIRGIINSIEFIS